MNVKVISKILIDSDETHVWDCLCDAKMEISSPWWFKLGIPTPQQCLVVNENKGVVTNRQCQTSQGIINQKIIEWHPYYRLSFVPISDTIGLDNHVKNMKDTFFLKSVDGKILLTRLTQIEVIGIGAKIKSIMLRLILKNIHVFVMKNFKTIAEKKRHESFS
ncbi:MAG: hypothetical protein ACRBB2_08215 [Nitrosopumilus sp.]